MKKCMQKALFFISLFLVLVGNITFSQTVAGKVFLKEDADRLFGPVQQFVKLSTTQFEFLLSLAGDYILFRYEDTGLYIFNKERRLLFSSGELKSFSSSDVLKKYSMSVVKELLSKGKSTSVIIEKRQKVMSVTNGEYTMEYADDCPPNCLEQ